jgi:hypothetical protein
MQCQYYRPNSKEPVHAQNTSHFSNKKREREREHKEISKMAMYVFYLEYVPGQIGVGDQDGSDNVMRHHDREVLTASLPGDKSTNAVDVEAALAHVEEHKRRAA